MDPSGYNHTLFRENAINSCMIIIPWGGCCYKHLTMGIGSLTEMFQHKMNDLFHGF